MNTFNLTISTPDGNAFNGECVRLVLRGDEGDLAIMANHTPIITGVKPCTAKIEIDENTSKSAHIDGGLLTVSENKATLLCGIVTMG
ncbi:MAG TPA: F0F1 ATP synthase subunit epsilon [Clostridiales bacterium]|nr:F0F1 ATP synthase subunit epsilon [Clostridiales bacterium]